MYALIKDAASGVYIIYLCTYSYFVITIVLDEKWSAVQKRKIKLYQNNNCWVPAYTVTKHHGKITSFFLQRFEL